MRRRGVYILLETLPASFLGILDTVWEFAMVLFTGIARTLKANIGTANGATGALGHLGWRLNVTHSRSIIHHVHGTRSLAASKEAI